MTAQAVTNFVSSSECCVLATGDGHSRVGKPKSRREGFFSSAFSWPLREPQAEVCDYSPSGSILFG
jgi:hypothetical protein